MKNRWGRDIRKGMKVSAHHPRGGTIEGRVERLITVQGYGKRAALDNGSDIGIDDIFKVHEEPTSYVTTYCNFEHRVRDGKPICHECYVIPPKALQLEIDGKVPEAIEVMVAAMRVYNVLHGRTLKPHKGLKGK